MWLRDVWIDKYCDRIHSSKLLTFSSVVVMFTTCLWHFKVGPTWVFHVTNPYPWSLIIPATLNQSYKQFASQSIATMQDTWKLFLHQNLAFVVSMLCHPNSQIDFNLQPSRQLMEFNSTLQVFNFPILAIGACTSSCHASYTSPLSSLQGSL